MSVRDRISNLNSLKTPIITAASHDSTHAHPGHSSSSNTSSTENSAEKEGTDGTEVGSSKPSTIAERIAKLKAANAHKDVAVPSPINRIALKSPFPPPSADADSSIAEADATPKGSIKSRIAMLGANINLTAHSANNPNQFNPFAAQSSRGNSETNSRESHLDPHPSLATTGSNLNSSEHTRDKCEIDGDGNALSTSAPIMAGKSVLKGNLVHLTMQRPGRPGGARPSNKNITKEKLISEEPAETVAGIVEEIAAPISNDDAVTEAVQGAT